MGYSGRVDQNNRTKSIIIDEAYRVLRTGLQMIESIKEIKNTLKAEHSLDYQDLDIRVGIHTGKIIAGIIGSKIVKYDIFGENVLIASKIKSNALMGKVCVSEETLNLLKAFPKLYKNYEFQPVKWIDVETINRLVKVFSVQTKE